ncbi:hypothetical protein COLO4_03144 [Corchorus olitorius]|uniref:Uncharacterized protein n=1 Tax=Corchorus olitorius TaxID=93759 RepID=A0A1R3KZK5_9ROSI|nr:hypothetical protein COLO4_03144 [Corchorus olitorius]
MALEFTTTSAKPDLDPASDLFVKAPTSALVFPTCSTTVD